ncbi:MAG: polymerase subunit delta [Solirubrobacteraceae bacterium]|nr:polymerase subunit delta [Solirubrobacteraceae bacterium]
MPSGAVGPGTVSADAGSRLGDVATFKPAYLVHGDDHGRIAERRARLRAMAESESGTGGVEVFEGDAATPEAVAMALRSMTFAIGRRFLIVDGVERWKDADVESLLLPALATIAPETTVVFFAREEGRAKAPAKLGPAVKKAGGDVDAETALKPRELPRWVAAEADRLGLKLEGAAAKALIARVGERQQRLLRELEKLALEHGEGATIGVEEVEGAAAASAERQVWALVDALVARDRSHATRAFLELRAQGETLPRLVPLVARRVRDVLAIAARLDAGESPAQVKGSLRMSPWAADQRIKEARATDVDALQRTLEQLAELELSSRGNTELAEETAALRAIDAITV